MEELITLIWELSTYSSMCLNRTMLLYLDVKVGDATPVKQHPYLINHQKAKLLREEINHMLEIGISKPSQSSWSSPCVSVEKSDRSAWFCTHHYRVSVLTKNDCQPVPRMNSCIYKIGKAITKCDLYYCVPLTEKVKEISAFVTPIGFIRIHRGWKIRELLLFA